jgi:pimeloyl-ACP methyl ester carboxylesterase
MYCKILIFKILFLASLLITTSCGIDDDGQVPVTNDRYLVSYNKANTLPVNISQSIFTAALGSEFPVQALYDVSVYKVSYRTSFKDKDMVASGVLCLPAGASGNMDFPILSFQNGTNTLHSQAPSVFLENPSFMVIQAIASLGYAVVIPDYIGFGSSSNHFHPYLEKTSTVTSIIDMYGAVMEIADKYLEVPVGDDLYLMGYSQGAWASVALAETIENSPSARYKLKGTAVGAGVYNLTTLVENILEKETYPSPAFLGYLINSYIKTGIVSITYRDVFNAPFADQVQGFYNGKRDITAINDLLTEDLASLFTQEFRNGYKTESKYESFKNALVLNSIQPWKIKSPVFIRHGNDDVTVSVTQSLGLRNDFLQRQVPENQINYKIYPLENHSSALVPFAKEAMVWLLSLK